jgi:glucose-6-phosphate 1-dehydrogenase
VSANNQSQRCLFVVFGATGDLNKRKLLPALARLVERGILADSHILGVARSTEMDDRAFREMAREIVGEGRRDWCDSCVHYRSMSDILRAEVEALEKKHSLPGNRVFYLALPPQSFATTIEALGRSRLQESAGWTRVVIEKPFGRDLESAKELNRLLHRYFEESQIFRIDHYLGKETVQNILVFRFANPIFESLWDRNHIDNVQITVAETLGVEARAGYYDQTGAVRDMVQNHLTQVLSLIAMGVPSKLGAEPVRDEKAKVLHSIAPIKAENVVFGQYDGYRREPGVAADSRTETMVALKLEINNWRWNHVPFYLRTGKRLGRHASEIVITFRRPPVSVFEPFGAACEIEHNVLVITIQPDESFRLKFHVKAPGQPVLLVSRELAFQYKEEFESVPDGYETLLQDILEGDQALFVRADWIEASWQLYDRLLQSPPSVSSYVAGTWGPAEADKLLLRDGRSWVNLASSPRTVKGD